MLAQKLAREAYLSSQQARLTVTSMQPLQQQWQQLAEVAHTGQPQSLHLAGNNKVWEVIRDADPGHVGMHLAGVVLECPATAASTHCINVRGDTFTVHRCSAALELTC
jgi:hypothetical protein